MPAAKYSEELKEQVVREVIEKERATSSVASSHDLASQTVGNWVARYRKEHATDQDRKKASESAEIAKLRAEVRELHQENEFLKIAAAFFAKERPRPNATSPSIAKKPLSHLLDVQTVPGVKIRTHFWRDRPQSQTAIRREEPTTMVKDVFEDSDGTYGYRRIQVVLEGHGVWADGATIRSIVSDLGLQGAQPRAKRSGPLCRPRTWMSGRTCSVGTSPLTKLDVSGARTLLRQDVGWVRLSCDRSGLLHQEGRGLSGGRPHAHVPGVPGH